jgi:hypothetical protein
MKALLVPSEPNARCFCLSFNYAYKICMEMGPYKQKCAQCHFIGLSLWEKMPHCWPSDISFKGLIIFYSAWKWAPTLLWLDNSDLEACPYGKTCPLVNLQGGTKRLLILSILLFFTPNIALIFTFFHAHSLPHSFLLYILSRPLFLASIAFFNSFTPTLHALWCKINASVLPPTPPLLNLFTPFLYSLGLTI